MKEEIDLYDFGLSIANLVTLVDRMKDGHRADILNICKEDVVILIAALSIYHRIGDELKELKEAVLNLKERST